MLLRKIIRAINIFILYIEKNLCINGSVQFKLLFKGQLYFILLNTITVKFAFLISFLDCLVKVYRNITDYCKLVLYPAILLIHLLALLPLLWILGISIRIMSSLSKDSPSFNFFFLSSYSG